MLNLPRNSLKYGYSTFSKFFINIQDINLNLSLTSTKQKLILKSILSKCKLPDKPNSKKAFSVAKIKDKWYLILDNMDKEPYNYH